MVVIILGRWIYHVIVIWACIYKYSLQILDATFDDILPLAVKQMPEFLEPMVNITIRNHANLDVASQLIQYNGPIRLIRRSEDEIISIT